MVKGAPGRGDQREMELNSLCSRARAGGCGVVSGGVEKVKLLNVGRVRCHMTSSALLVGALVGPFFFTSSPLSQSLFAPPQLECLFRSEIQLISGVDTMLPYIDACACPPQGSFTTLN